MDGLFYTETNYVDQIMFDVYFVFRFYRTIFSLYELHTVFAMYAICIKCVISSNEALCWCYLLYQI